MTYIYWCHLEKSYFWAQGWRNRGGGGAGERAHAPQIWGDQGDFNQGRHNLPPTLLLATPDFQTFRHSWSFYKETNFTSLLMKPLKLHVYDKLE